MKRLHFTFFAALVLSTMLHAQNNNLVVYSQEGLRFTMILNGIRQNTQPETNVKVTGLNAPNYSMKIIFENGLPDLDQNVYCMYGGDLTRNMEYTSAIVNKKGKYKLQFKSAAPAGQTVAYNPNQTVMPYNTGTAPACTPAPVCNTQPAATATTTTTTNTVGITASINGIHGTTTTTVTTSGTSTNGGHMRPNDSHNPAPRPNPAAPACNAPYTLPGYTGAYGCPQPMTASDFESAKQSIKSKGFDDTRLTLAKQIIGSNCLLCSQIKELMELMSFEDTKLNLAKYAWSHNLDKGNYYKLNDAFHFSSSIDELNKYTEEH